MFASRHISRSTIILVVSLVLIVNGIAFMAFRHLHARQGGTTALVAPDDVNKTARAAERRAEALSKGAMTDIVNSEWEAADEKIEAAMRIKPNDPRLKEMRAKVDAHKAAAGEAPGEKRGPGAKSGVARSGP